MSDFAWLIERGQREYHFPTIWWIAGPSMLSREGEEWTQDASQATRFRTQEGAENVIDRLFTRLSDVSAHAAEHGFFDRISDESKDQPETLNSTTAKGAYTEHETNTEMINVRGALLLARHSLGLLAEVLWRRVVARPSRSRPVLGCTCGAGEACDREPCHGHPRNATAEQIGESLRDRIVLAITDSSVSWGYVSDSPDVDPGPMMTTRDAIVQALGMTLDEVFAESNRLRHGEQKAALHNTQEQSS